MTSSSGVIPHLFISRNGAVSQLLSSHSLHFRNLAHIFRCRDKPIICTKMTTPSQLGTLCGKIHGLEAEKLETKKTLAAAQEPADIAFLRQQLGDLNK